jgi:hypothetical protein
MITSRRGSRRKRLKMLCGAVRPDWIDPSHGRPSYTEFDIVESVHLIV